MENSSDNNFLAAIIKAIPTAGKMKLTEKEKKALYREIKDEELLIKKDGTVYAPWPVYAGRLNDAVTGVGWSLIPQGNPEERVEGSEKMIFWGFHFMIRGFYCGFAYGVCKRSPDMDWSNAIEGAKSNALMRLCKEIGIGLKLWDKKFITEWQAKNAWQSERGWHQGKKPEGQASPPQAAALKEGKEKGQVEHKGPDPAPPPAPAPIKVNPADAIVKDLDAGLAIIQTMPPLTLAWSELDPEIQRDKRVFDIFKNHIKRVKALPKKVEKIYGESPEEQERALGDFLAVLRAYKTGTEAQINLETEIADFIAKGLMKENTEIARLRAEKLVFHKKETNGAGKTAAHA